MWMTPKKQKVVQLKISNETKEDESRKWKKTKQEEKMMKKNEDALLDVIKDVTNQCLVNGMAQQNRTLKMMLQSKNEGRMNQELSES